MANQNHHTLVASLISNEISSKMKTYDWGWDFCLIRPQDVSDIAHMILEGTISRNTARRIIDIMWEDRATRWSAVAAKL